MSVGVDVENGVTIEVTVGICVSIERGVICGCGGVLTHAANPINKRMSHDHFAIFTTRTRRENYDF
jgi:hypothetical protein